jgi:hypothetical protein
MPKQPGNKPFSKPAARHVMNAAGFFSLCLSTSLAMAVAEKPAAAGTGGKPISPTSLQWKQVFASNNAARYLEFTAHYRDAKGNEHQLHYWRDGNRRLRRNTDGNADLMVEHLSNGEYRYHALDHRKKIITHIDQTNLQRIGQFINWDNLARALTSPSLGATISKSSAADFSLDKYRCTWYDVAPVAEAGSTVPHQQICWSRALGIPLKITTAVTGQETTTWQVDHLSTGKLGDAAFTSNVAGYAVVNANQDISPESD